MKRVKIVVSIPEKELSFEEWCSYLERVVKEVEEQINKRKTVCTIIKEAIMKRRWLYLVLPIAFIAIVYLLYSWALWEPNPKNWGEEALGASSIMFAMVTGFGLLLAAIFNDVFNIR